MISAYFVTELLMREVADTSTIALQSFLYQTCAEDLASLLCVLLNRPMHRTKTDSLHLGKVR